MSVEVVPPRANPALVGQEQAERTLLAAWNSGRLPHAWLLAGPRGVGKATLAYRFARFVLAQRPDGEAVGGTGLFGAEPAPARPLGMALGSDHPVFRRVAAGGHADLMVLEPGMIHPETKKESAEIVVDHVRAAISFLGMTPAEGGWRVLVVDHAEEMNASSENALLKILEEPHARSLLLLVSHAPGRLLPTIRSRCRRLDMPALEPGIVATLLSRSAPGLEAGQGAALSVLAAGSVGRAIDLLEAGAIEIYEALLDVVAARDGAGLAMHALAERVGMFGPEGQASFRAFREVALHLAGACARCAAGAPVVAALPREAQALPVLAASGTGRWLAAWDEMRRLAAATEGLNLDRRQAAFATLASLREAAGQGRG
ncbi:MAG: DNA polymerase III subunit delta' [Alphaproteobacteria bacterium]|nr:DNA polymerase III subunit delta' [Alphaproteobacteria bacterium]MBM3629517.1 DNA polymerase III subunit delta' [Alphaproteobacteria bacterium]